MSCRMCVSFFAAALVFVSVTVLDAGQYNRVISIGDKAAAWNDLPGTDGKDHSLADLDKATAVAVIFTCNNCPVASAYQQRINELAKDFREKGLAVVAINVNQDENIVSMKSRADEEGFRFDYVYDESQASARKYGAVCTPHAFLLDKHRVVAYMGAIDNNWQDAASASKHYLRDAVRAVLDGETPQVQESRQQGCAIRWKAR